MAEVSGKDGAAGLARSGVSRRAAVALGIVGLSGLVGCNGAVPSASAPADAELDEARADFESAYSAAQEAWSSLQDEIGSAQAADEEFQAGVVKNPDTLTAFEAELASAQAVEDVYSDYEEEPETADELAEATEKLNAAADDYDEAVQKLASAQDAVELHKPGVGSFTYTDWDGYSYRVDYDINPKITVDTTEGKPGLVALYFDFSSCSVTLTNTTPGKKAPGMSFSLSPLYNVSDFSDFIVGGDESSVQYDVAMYGPLSQPATFEEAPSLNEIKELDYEKSYLNPFDNTVTSVNSDYGEVSRIQFSACATRQSYGSTMYGEGDELEVGETRELVCVFLSSALTGGKQKWTVGNIAEGYVDKFKKIVGWAVKPENGTYAPKDTAVFAGKYMAGAMLSEGIWLYGYNPVTG